MFSDGLLAQCRRAGSALGARLSAARASATTSDWLRLAVLVTICGLLVIVGVNVAASTGADDSTLQRGTVTEPADNTTVVSVQGYTFEGSTNDKKPARLITASERATTEWTYTSRQGSNAWFFDVDPLDNGNLLVVSPRSGETVIYELNPETEERIWERTLPFEDTHDADMLSEDELVIGHMRAWNETSEVSNDEVVIYNLTTDEITWRWRLRDHYPNSTDGGMNADWSHLNDVDQVGEHRLLLSPRNFDQAIVIDRRTDEIVRRLGQDDDYSVLNEQHNPDYLAGENGTPTMLVADSGNDRVVEYARLNGSWEQTWEVGADSLQWPRDADRLPNGNTLIVDSLNHRVIEVTPTGEIVWEYYATWGPYDAERLGTGDESNGPTIREQNATGSYELSGSAGLRPGTGDNLDFPARLRATFSETPLEGPASALARLWGHYMPWLRPVWLSSWDAAFLVGAGLLAVSWGGAEAILRRRRIAAGIRRRLPF